MSTSPASNSESLHRVSPAPSLLGNLFADQKVRLIVLDLALMLILALVAAEYALNYNIFLQAIPHDTTFHIYAAQQILDGHAIYRDVAIIKAPLSDFATALALIVGRALGISDMMSARLMSVLVVMGTASVTYLAGRELFKSRAVGLVAGLLMAGWDFYGLRAVTGPEPKAFLILFGILALVWIAQKRWMLAGASAAMTTLAWQPGLMVAALVFAGAFLEPWLEVSPNASASKWRAGAMQTLRAVGGFAIPMAFLILYLVWNDALVSAWNATIGANVNHFADEQAKTPLRQIIADNYQEIVSEGAQYCFSPLEYWAVLASAIGFVGIVLSQIEMSVRTKRVPLSLRRTPFVVYALGFAAFSLVDYDFCPDLFPLLPVLALSTGWLVWGFARIVAELAERFVRAEHSRYVRWLVTAIAVIVIVYVYLLDVRAYTVRGVNFQDQIAVVDAARTYLDPGDRVMTFGDTIVLIELHLENAHKILHIGSKSGLGVLLSEPGGIQGMLDELENDPPKIVTLSRETRPDWSAPIYAWLDKHYDTVQTFPRANVRILLRKP